jgi:hypothetical protein
MNSEHQADTIARSLAQSPPGTFKLFRRSRTGVEGTVEDHLQNMHEIGARVQYALQCGCLLEAIPLRLQIMYFWLWVYFVNEAPTGTQRKKEFGALLDQCERLGLPSNL